MFLPTDEVLDIFEEVFNDPEMTAAQEEEGYRLTGIDETRKTDDGSRPFIETPEGLALVILSGTAIILGAAAGIGYLFNEFYFKPKPW